MAAMSAGLAIALGFLCLAPLRAQGNAPTFEVDPAWPKPLPNLWVTGGIGGVCIDSRDHVFILNRRDLTDNDLDAGHQAPVVIEFDPEGNVVNSFGDPDTTPNTPHGCAVDAENNVWMTGNGDGIVQKYSHDGSKLLFQIGKRGVVDSSDGSAKGKALNSSHEGFFKPAGIAIDPKNGDVYVADGETPGGNHRIAVFDRTGQFLRQWDLHRTEAETGDAFVPVLHCVAMDNNGLVYVCDRRGHRIQVFDKMGNFQKNIPVEFEHDVQAPAGPGARARRAGIGCLGRFLARSGAEVHVRGQSRQREDRYPRSRQRDSCCQVSAAWDTSRANLRTLISWRWTRRATSMSTEVGTGKRIQKFKMVGSAVASSCADFSLWVFVPVQMTENPQAEACAT